MDIEQYDIGPELQVELLACPDADLDRLAIAAFDRKEAMPWFGQLCHCIVDAKSIRGLDSAPDHELKLPLDYDLLKIIHEFVSTPTDLETLCARMIIAAEAARLIEELVDQM